MIKRTFFSKPLERFPTIVSFSIAIFFLAMPSASAGLLERTPQRVLSVSPPLTTIVYMLAPEKLVGWNFRPDKKYRPQRYQKLPVVGGWFGNFTGNIETFYNYDPDIILVPPQYLGDFGYSAEKSGEKSPLIYSDRQKKFGSIPLVAIKGATEADGIPRSIRLIGDVLNVPQRAQELIDFHDHIRKIVEKRIQDIPPEKKVRVYYAERPNGLFTDPAGSMHSKLIELSGGMNVAECEVTPGKGQTAVSIEQVLIWNPDIIIVENREFLKKVYTHPVWKRIKAVKNHKVYDAPREPFGWFDRPPGANTIIGHLWVAEKFYPARFKDVDWRGLTRKFFRQFYHYKLSDKELHTLWGKTI